MERYLASLPDKRAQLQTHWNDFEQRPDPSSLQGVRDVLHRLAGSSVMYGFDALGAELRSAMHLADRLLDESIDERALQEALQRTMAHLLEHWTDLQ